MSSSGLHSQGHQNDFEENDVILRLKAERKALEAKLAFYEQGPIKGEIMGAPSERKNHPQVTSVGIKRQHSGIGEHSSASAPHGLSLDHAKRSRH